MSKINSDQIKSVIFHLNDEEYAIPVNIVGSIERMMHVTRVPGTPDFVKGVLNLRGVVTPLIDLRLRFGIEENIHTNQTRIIIIQHEEMEVGLIVDQAYDVLDIPKSSIEPAPESIGSTTTDLNEYIDGVAQYEDRLFILLNIDQILSKETFMTETLTQNKKLV